MTLDKQDREDIENIASETIPVWLLKAIAPIIVSLVSGLLAMGIWAGTISNDVNLLLEYKQENSPVSIDNVATLREIKSDLKHLRKDVERVRFEQDVIQSDFKDFRQEMSQKIDNIKPE